MASLQERCGSFRVLFKFQGRLHAFTIGKVDRNEAETKVAQVEYLLMRLKQRLLELPEGVDIVEFLKADGRASATAPIVSTARRRAVTLKILTEQYLETLRNGVEASSLGTVKTHLANVGRFLGDNFPVADLTLAKLQSYVNARAADGKARYTIAKEITTLGAAWTWGELMKLTTGKLPSRGLRYPKGEEKMPWMSFAEVESRGSSDPALWESMYSTTSELVEFLAFVKANAAHPWIYPLVCFAAYTGARRSEILRVQLADVNFERGVVLIHERKRDRTKRTTRTVPLTPPLVAVLHEWLQEHPGGDSLFSQAGTVFRSKKRSATTGHRSGPDRAKTVAGRVATVRSRIPAAPAGLTKDEVHDHFRRTLAGSKWARVPGFHTLRHSFISACASKGVDQRFIDEWVGHSTDEQRRRYRHLYPSIQRAALAGVFS